MQSEWKTFFEGYRRRPVESDADLFVQVGRTVNGEPISEAEFQQDVQRVVDKLRLEPTDILFEHCCGNGLVSFELASRVRHVIGVDFTEHLIEAARQRRQRPNIEYHVGNALEPLERFTGSQRPTKYLMSFALAHFTPDELGVMLEHILAVNRHDTFLFLITGVPDVDSKWNFYDTPERKARHLENQQRGDRINDGIGRWWSSREIAEVASRHGLTAETEPERLGPKNYRMDALIG